MWPSSQFPADLLKFKEEILNEKFNFCAVWVGQRWPREKYPDSYSHLFQSFQYFVETATACWKSKIEKP